MLVQADGSPHRWLGPEQPPLTLIGGIDDATGTVPWALFREQEDAAGYMTWLQQVVTRHGVPQALYVDRHGIFVRQPKEPSTPAEELAGQRAPTQFGRVLAELGITPIYAQSPQAKGRIERLWATFQDRLVSELRLAGATTMSAATVVLERFVADFNQRFAVPAAEMGSAYRPVPPGFVAEQVFCFKYERVDGADNTVQVGEHRLQLVADRQRTSYAKVRVEVQERLDGSLAVYSQGRCLATQAAPLEAPKLRARKLPRPSLHQPDIAAPQATPPKPVGPGQPGPTGTAPHKPSPDHPWRRAYPNAQRTKSPVT